MRVEQGVLFAKADDGRRSTTAAGKAILAAAAAAVDDRLATQIKQTSDWREGYIGCTTALTECALRSAQAANRIAAAGLAAAYEQFVFDERPLRDAVADGRPQLYTASVRGQGVRRPLVVPYKGEQLVGQALERQLATWQERDIIEVSHRAAIAAVDPSEPPQQTVVLMGAGAEMGPIGDLLALGATVIAVDIAQPQLWQRLLDVAQQSAGTLLFPVDSKPPQDASAAWLAQHAGADLITQTPQIAAWLQSFTMPLVLCCYAYLDGGDHVRVAMAMDAIYSRLQDGRDDVALAFLLTPTDVYGVAADVISAAEANYERKRWAQVGQRLTFGRWFRPGIRGLVGCDNGNSYGIVDSQLTQQGPNYALAKRLQRWRALTVQAAGGRVSCNVAPATFTSSVMKKRLFVLGYRGAETFGVEIFRPQTTSALMGMMLLHDLKQPLPAYAHPHELFMDGANHGGIWRIGLQLRSALTSGVIAGLLRRA